MSLYQRLITSFALLSLGCNEGSPAGEPEPVSKPLAVANATASPGAQTPAGRGVVPAGRIEAAKICQRVCTQSAPLGCPAMAACEPSCREMAEAPQCQQEMLTFLQCLSTQATAHWECGEDGAPSIKEGFCDAEQGAFVACLG